MVQQNGKALPMFSVQECKSLRDMGEMAGTRGRLHVRIMEWHEG